jgi:ABC-type nitrate/sulfonate/bicarbonate transport system substrate-binding protein
MASKGGFILDIKKPSASSTVFAYVGSGVNVDVLKFSHGKGLFKKHGLDMSMIYFSDEVMSTQAVVSGTASAATAPATDVLKALSEGAAMKIIMVNIDRFDHLFVARAGINSLKDLQGKKVAVVRYGSFTDIAARFLLRQGGMDPDKDVQIIQLGNAPVRAAALSSGGVDGTPMTLGFIPVVKKAGFNVIFDMSTVPTKFANRSVVASDHSIKEQPHIVKAIVAGFVEGTRYWKGHPEEAKAYLKKTSKLPDEDIDHIYSQTNRFMRSEPTPDLDAIRNAWEHIPTLKDRGTFDFKKVVDARFIEEVLKEMR